VKPRASRGGGIGRSWRVLRSAAPPNDAARPRCCRPRAELVTLPLTLSVAPRFDRAEARSPRGARSAYAAVSSKTTTSSDQSAFHRRVLSCESPPPFSRLRRREPASGARSLLVHPGGFPSRAGELDPLRFRLGQAPLVDFCNQNNPRARAADPSIPGLRPGGCPLVCGPGGVAPLSPRIKRPGTNRRNPSRGFTGQGPGWLSPSRRLALRLLTTRALPQPDPLGHLVSWTREERGWIGRSLRAHELVVCRLRTHPPGSLALSQARPRTTRSRGANAGLALSHGTSQRRHSLARAPPSVEGRLRRSSAKRSAFRCTQGAFHSWASPFGVRGFPQDVTILWSNHRRLCNPLSSRCP